MSHSEIIQKIIDKIGAKIYLEIGAASGFNFLNLRAKRKFAIDPKNKIPARRWLSHFSNFFHSQFYEMTSDNFFLGHSDLFKKDKIDVAFIDGMHTYAQSLKDVENCLKFLSEKGVIIMHDCNPISEQLASPTPNKGAWNGDVWKTIALLRTMNNLRVFVLDTDYGVGIITRGPPENSLFLTKKEIEKLTYSDLKKNRKDYLNLKSESYLETFLH